jgi:hypothetical protein
MLQAEMTDFFAHKITVRSTSLLKFVVVFVVSASTCCFLKFNKTTTSLFGIWGWG